MTATEGLVKALDGAIWEMSEVFDGLDDLDVWKRAHQRLWSVGELAAHIAYGEADTFLGKAIDSALVNNGIAYYETNIDVPYTLSLTAQDLYNEVKRVHEVCKDGFLKLAPDLESPCPFREGWTWEYALQYQVFHVSYHVGQMYSVRHIMGHNTNNN